VRFSRWLMCWSTVGASLHSLETEIFCPYKLSNYLYLYILNPTLGFVMCTTIARTKVRVCQVY
jgi:hypothetical protein